MSDTCPYCPPATPWGGSPEMYSSLKKWHDSGHPPKATMTVSGLVGAKPLATSDNAKKPTPVPTTILETLREFRTQILFNDSSLAELKAITEIETYYTTRLKKCIGEMEYNYRLYLTADTSIPIELNQAKAKLVLRAKNGLRAEILSKWEAEQ